MITRKKCTKMNLRANLVSGLLILSAALTLPSASAQDTGAQILPGENRLYCTQLGPLLISFARGKAAGTYRILGEDRVGAFAGTMSDFELLGEWLEQETRGSIRILFSSDWSSFEVAHSIAPSTDEWRTGWSGYMPPAGTRASFKIEGETYFCQ